MGVTFGDITFDHVLYDDLCDSLVLGQGPMRAGGDWYESQEGDPLRLGGVIGVEIMSARYRLDRDGQITITIEDGTVLGKRRSIHLRRDHMVPLAVELIPVQVERRQLGV